MATGKEIWKIVEEFGRRQKAEGIEDLPWPDYNGRKQFLCQQCGTRFDTSTGYARHQVYDCAVKKEKRK